MLFYNFIIAYLKCQHCLLAFFISTLSSLGYLRRGRVSLVFKAPDLSSLARIEIGINLNIDHNIGL